MEQIWQDVKYGARMLLKSPGFTLVAVLTLALGIGANSAIFSVVNAVLLRPLPYPNADRLVFLTEWSQQVPNMSFSFEDFKDVRDQNKVFESVVASRSQGWVLTGLQETEQLNGRAASSGLFATMGIQPILGRAFTPDEDKPGGQKVVLLGEGFWTRRFARDPGVLGRQLQLDNVSYTVIGVMPGNLHRSMQLNDVWTPLMQDEGTQGGPNQRGSHPGIYLAARMKPGITVEQARAEVVGIAQRLAEQYPNSNAKQSMTVVSFLDAVVGDLRSALWVLLGAVVFVLLIACSNVANLLLARAAARQKEIAVRTALGAGRRRIIRQLLTESVLLSVVGGVLGMALAYGGVRALVAITPANTPRMDEVRLDGAVLAFTMLLSIGTGLVFGLFPALQSSKSDTAETLKEGGRGASAGVARHRVRSALVIAEVSMALVLLVGAGLMLRSFMQILDADPGFNPERVMTASFSLPDAKYSDPAKARLFIDSVVKKVQAIPGVDSAATTLPLLGGFQNGFVAEGQPEPRPGQFPSTDVTRITPDYFRAMGMPIQKGRAFTDMDIAGQPLVCIVDETMVQTYWPGQDPLGKHIRFGANVQNPQMTIVGVVPHVKNYGVDQESRVEIYLPVMQNTRGFATFVIRTAGDPGAVTSAVRQALASVDPDIPLFRPRALEDILSDSRGQRRIAAQLLAAFSLLALTLAAVGIYGVMAYAVQQRTHEIGIRLALGAQKNDILKMIVGHGMILAGIGVAIGWVTAFGVSFSLSRAVSTLLFRVSSADPPTFASMPLLLAAVALLACYIPARRALRVDPMIALRYE